MKDNSPKSIGKAIRNLRKQSGITQEMLGESSNLSGKYIGEIERGNKNPTVNVIFRIANALGRDPSHILSMKPPLLGKAVYLERLNVLLEGNDEATRNLVQAIESLLNGNRV